jgi:hypothetical protein
MIRCHRCCRHRAYAIAAATTAAIAAAAAAAPLPCLPPPSPPPLQPTDARWLRRWRRTTWLREHAPSVALWASQRPPPTRPRWGARWRCRTRSSCPQVCIVLHFQVQLQPLSLHDILQCACQRSVNTAAVLPVLLFQSWCFSFRCGGWGLMSTRLQKSSTGVVTLEVAPSLPRHSRRYSTPRCCCRRHHA